MKRYQDCNWLVKLWRRRWYIWAYYKALMVTLEYSDADFKTNLSIAKGIAEVEMNWVYDMEDILNEKETI